jgi:quinolinate synthase
MTTLDKLLSSLSTLSPQIEVPEGIRVRAKQALDRMLAL